MNWLHTTMKLPQPDADHRNCDTDSCCRKLIGVLEAKGKRLPADITQLRKFGGERHPRSPANFHEELCKNLYKHCKILRKEVARFKFTTHTNEDAFSFKVKPAQNLMASLGEKLLAQPEFNPPELLMIVVDGDTGNFMEFSDTINFGILLPKASEKCYELQW